MERPLAPAVPVRWPDDALIRLAPGARRALRRFLEATPDTATSQATNESGNPARDSASSECATGSVLWVRPDHAEPLVIARCSPPLPEGYRIERVDGLPLLFEERQREQLRGLRVEFVPGPGGGFRLGEPHRDAIGTDDMTDEASLACTSCASAHLPPLPEDWAVASGRTERRGPSLPVLPGTSV